MVKKIEDYKKRLSAGGDLQIICKSKEEYVALIPHLNTIWRNWRPEIFDRCIDPPEYPLMFIYRDCCFNRCESDRGFIEASEFLVPEVNNAYPIY